MTPLIGVTPDTHDGRKLKTRSKAEKIVYLWDRYLQALLDHGAIPVILPVTTKPAQVKTMIERLSGVMLAGGNFDVPPAFYGEKNKRWLGKLKPERSEFELLLLKTALERDLPVLGICGGLQLLNVARGGTLYQDILKERPGSRNHQQQVSRTRPSHQVTAPPGTLFHRIVGGVRLRSELKLRVNSTHHQAVKDLGRGVVAGAVAADGVIEAIELADRRFALGVQWHPELLYPRHPEQSRIFKAFVGRAADP